VSAAGLRLVPFGAEHVDELATWLDDPGILRFTHVPHPVPGGFARAWYQRYEEGRAAGNREAFVAVDNDASNRVAAKAGYAWEGVLRSLPFKANLRSDTVVWSRQPTDP